MKTVAIFGGTFDPIHQGHLQSALELKQRLQLDELRMLPSGLPPHRESPGCSAQQRLAMVRLACADTGLVVDDRELRRQGPSYSIDTLEQLRAELGDQVSLIWVMGADAFAEMHTWKRWRDMLRVAHLVVIARPGAQWPEQGAIAELLAQHREDQAADLHNAASGRLVRVTLTPYAVSASGIRRQIADDEGKGEVLDKVLPASVVNYIEQHQLYR